MIVGVHLVAGVDRAGTGGGRAAAARADTQARSRDPYTLRAALSREDLLALMREQVAENRQLRRRRVLRVAPAESRLGPGRNRTAAIRQGSTRRLRPRYGVPAKVPLTCEKALREGRAGYGTGRAPPAGAAIKGWSCDTPCDLWKLADCERVDVSTQDP